MGAWDRAPISQLHRHTTWTCGHYRSNTIPSLSFTHFKHAGTVKTRISLVHGLCTASSEQTRGPTREENTTVDDTCPPGAVQGHDGMHDGPSNLLVS